MSKETCPPLEGTLPTSCGSHQSPWGLFSSEQGLRAPKRHLGSPAGTARGAGEQALGPGLPSRLGLGHLMGPNAVPRLTPPLGPQGIALSIGTDLAVDA